MASPIEELYYTASYVWSLEDYKGFCLVGPLGDFLMVLSLSTSDFWGTAEISGTADTPTGGKRNEWNGAGSDTWMSTSVNIH